MNNSLSTPSSQSKKRDLSSPEELTLSKKNRVNSGTSDSTDTIISTVSSPSADMAATNIALDSSAIQSIADALKDTVLAQVNKAMTVAVESIVKGVVEGLSTRIASLETENDSLKAANQALVSRVVVLEQTADSAEQYSRRNCLRFSGVKESADENTDDVVMGICKDMGSPILLAEIDRSHRVGKQNPNGKPRAIIVKFSTYRVRHQIYKNRTKLRNCGHSGVYVNEDLTRPRSELLYQARGLWKANRIEGAWSSDGTVLVRAAGVIRRVQTPDDLAKFRSPVASDSGSGQ